MAHDDSQNESIFWHIPRIPDFDRPKPFVAASLTNLLSKKKYIKQNRAPSFVGQSATCEPRKTVTIRPVTKGSSARPKCPRFQVPNYCGNERKR